MLNYRRTMANVADGICISTTEGHEGHAVRIRFAFVSKRDQRIIGTQKKQDFTGRTGRNDRSHTNGEPTQATAKQRIDRSIRQRRASSFSCRSQSASCSRRESYMPFDILCTSSEYLQRRNVHETHSLVHEQREPAEARRQMHTRILNVP